MKRDRTNAPSNDTEDTKVNLNPIRDSNIHHKNASASTQEDCENPDGLVDLLSIALNESAYANCQQRPQRGSDQGGKEDDDKRGGSSLDDVCYFARDSSSAYLHEIFSSDCVDLTSSNEQSPGTSSRVDDATASHHSNEVYQSAHLNQSVDSCAEYFNVQDCQERLFLCKVCPYRSFKKWDFMNHIRIHTGEKPFSCPFCPHKSALKNNLRRHIMLKHPNTHPQI